MAITAAGTGLHCFMITQVLIFPCLSVSSTLKHWVRGLSFGKWCTYEALFPPLLSTGRFHPFFHLQNRNNIGWKQPSPPGRRPRAWPAWPAVGRTQPGTLWGSWWWSAERAPVTRPRTPARYRTPRRRWGAPAAPRRSCTEARRAMESCCSWGTSGRRTWGRPSGSVRGRGWQTQTDCSQERTEGRKEGRARPTRWAKSWFRAEDGCGQHRVENNDGASHGSPCAHFRTNRGWILDLTVEKNKDKALVWMKGWGQTHNSALLRQVKVTTAGNMMKSSISDYSD